MTKILNILKPYRITVVSADGWTATHHAWSGADALDWAALYGAGWGTSTITRFGRFVASITR